MGIGGYANIPVARDIIDSVDRIDSVYRRWVAVLQPGSLLFFLHTMPDKHVKLWLPKQAEGLIISMISLEQEYRP